MQVASVESRHASRRTPPRTSRAKHRGCCKAVIGIDLGTTHSGVSVLEGGSAQVIPADGEHMLLPSLVCFHPTAGAHIHHVADVVIHACRQTAWICELQIGFHRVCLLTDPLVGSLADDCSEGVLVDNVKRLMGKSFSEAATLQQQMSYPVQEAADGTIEVVCASDGRSFSPEQVSAEILKVRNDSPPFPFLKAVSDR